MSIGFARLAASSMLLVVALSLAACTDHSNPNGAPSGSSRATPSSTPTGSTLSPPSTSSPAPTSTPTSAPNPAPRQVVGLTAETGGGSGEVLLTWTQNPEPDVVSYIVYRALTPGGSATRIGTASRHDVDLFSQNDPFVDPNATVGYYRVRAVDSAGQRGPLSAEVCGTGLGANGVTTPGYRC